MNPKVKEHIQWLDIGLESDGESLAGGFALFFPS
jgi:hypothetical protein